MHERCPPKNVMLCEPSCQLRTIERRDAHRWEYTPGMFAFSSVAGSGASQRSGFHASASAPHKALLRLLAWRSTTTVVPLGTRISLVRVPSTPRRGWDRGSRMSCCALQWFKCSMSDGIQTEERERRGTCSRQTNGTGGYLQAHSRPGSVRQKNERSTCTYNLRVSRHTASR